MRWSPGLSPVLLGSFVTSMAFARYPSCRKFAGIFTPSLALARSVPAVSSVASEPAARNRCAFDLLRYFMMDPLLLQMTIFLSCRARRSTNRWTVDGVREPEGHTACA